MCFLTRSPAFRPLIDKAREQRIAGAKNEPSNSLCVVDIRVWWRLDQRSPAPLHGLRLDTKEGVLAKLKSGSAAVIPGKADESDLIFRIEIDDAEAKMPPKKSGKQLTARQIETLRQWVDQGASWTTHWAFEPPRKTDLPAVKDAGWPRNPIDRFILARLEAEGLHPSPEAEATWPATCRSSARTSIRRPTP